jgi:hypothetical protein
VTICCPGPLPRRERSTTTPGPSTATSCRRSEHFGSSPSPPADVAVFLHEKLQAGLAVRTVARLRTVLGTALGHAVLLGHLQRNVALLVRPPRGTIDRGRSLTLSQGRELLLYRLADGSFFVRLEDIETPHAPAVFVYLVPRSSQTEPNGGVDLGALKGNVGSQNYVVPQGVDVTKYGAVLL